MAVAALHCLVDGGPGVDNGVHGGGEHGEGGGQGVVGELHDDQRPHSPWCCESAPYECGGAMDLTGHDLKLPLKKK